MIESQICTVLQGKLHNQNAERHQGRRAVSRELPHRPTPPKLWGSVCVAEVRLEPKTTPPNRPAPWTTHPARKPCRPRQARADEPKEGSRAFFITPPPHIIAARQRRHIARDAAGVAGRVSPAATVHVRTQEAVEVLAGVLVSRPKTPPAPAPARRGSQHLRRGSRGEKAVGPDDGPARCVRAGSGHRRLLPPRRGEAIKRQRLQQMQPPPPLPAKSGFVRRESRGEADPPSSGAPLRRRLRGRPEVGGGRRRVAPIQ